MILLALYDISNDAERTRISELCLDFGLERIQYSVFLGELDRKLHKLFLKNLNEKLPQEKFNIRVFEINKTVGRRLVFEASIDRDA